MVEYEYYQNLKEFFKYRNFENRDPWLNQDLLETDISYSRFIKIRAFNEKKEPLNVFMLPYEFESISKSSEFGNIFKISEIQNSNLMIFYETKDLSRIKKFFNTTDYLKLSTKFDITVYPMKIIKCIHPLIHSASKYRILSKEEKDFKFKNELCCDPQDYGRIIYDMDPPIVWYNGKPGDLVEIIRKHEHAIAAIDYKLVEATP